MLISRFWSFFILFYTGVNLGMRILDINHSSPSVTLRYIGINQDNIDKSYMNFSLQNFENN